MKNPMYEVRLCIETKDTISLLLTKLYLIDSLDDKTYSYYKKKLEKLSCIIDKIYWDI